MTSSEVGAGRLPTAEDEARFWALIEAAWRRLGRKVNKARAALATRKPDPEAEYDDVDEALDDFIEALTAECRELSATELTDLDSAAPTAPAGPPDPPAASAVRSGQQRRERVGDESGGVHLLAGRADQHAAYRRMFQSPALA